MKKYGCFILGILFPALLLTSCLEDLPTNHEFTAYQFAELNYNSSQWKLLIHSSRDQISISTPAQVGSTELKMELEDARIKIYNATEDQQASVKFWTNNPLIRWNEIALELATKYNLIPAPNPDGTYPSPDPANPGRYPLFPYSHPPYTSRMLAYLSVAQYDGLLMAWHYKNKFKRPAAYELDPLLTSAYEKNGLYSYPSDGAVIAIVSKEILTVMFPLEKEYLFQKALEHLESLVLSGMNVASDVEAGKLIGAEVAKTALARASSDGMINAQANRESSDSIKNADKERFGWFWENQESPQRLIGLVPLFGRVTLWNVPNVEIVRPTAPPSPSSEKFRKDTEELKQIRANLTTKQRRMANFWNDGLNTYGPPGHWNRIAKETVINNRLSPVKTAQVFAYMNMAIMDAGISCWDAKYYYHYPRPIQTIYEFRTVLGTPNFPAYTSGHATFSAAAAEVLSYFFPSEAKKFQDKAKEASESRIYGGIHYRFDADAGLAQGKAVGGYSVEKAKKDGVN